MLLKHVNGACGSKGLMKRSKKRQAIGGLTRRKTATQAFDKHGYKRKAAVLINEDERAKELKETPCLNIQQRRRYLCYVICWY